MSARWSTGWLPNAASGGISQAIPFNVYKQEASAGDVLGPRTAVAAAGPDPSANDTTFYVIITSDLAFVLSFFVLGEEFWEKLKRLFTWEGRVEPAS